MSDRDAKALRDRIARIDGAGYKRYREIEGSWDLPGFTLFVDRAQSDPFATPSVVRVEIGPEGTGIPEAAVRTGPRRLGVASWLAARFAEASSEVRGHGTGRSGEVRMEHPGQTVLAQTAVITDAGGGLEARFSVGLPGRGRRVDGPGAAALLLQTVPELVRTTLVLDPAAATGAIEAAETNEDAEALRDFLHREGLIAFVADGARLPRASGIDDRPLETDGVVRFESPPDMRARAELPNAGAVTGMAVRPGVTLVTGGGFHGKSTLLRALESGVYNHRPGDGRERVVTRADAVKIRAEDGRSVQGVDISGFIDGLPFGRDTHAFTTPNASGSTSQAASIVEALEAGAGILLIDEDTSATNFMTRDRRMQELVPSSGEPITPFVDRVRVLWDDHGVSTVLVVGGTGDYLDVADAVVRMEAYRPTDVTAEARSIAERYPTGRRGTAGAGWALSPARSIEPESLDARRGKRPTYVRVPDERTLLLGRNEIDVSAVEQLASRAQLRAIGLAMALLATEVGATSTVSELLDRMERLLDDQGLDALEPHGRPRGDLAGFRRYELAATLSRLRSLSVGGGA